MAVNKRPLWEGAGIRLYTKDLSDKNSVGIPNKYIKEVIYHLKVREGFTEIAGRTTIRCNQKGITLSDYQGRHLFLSNKNIPEAIKLLEEG